MRHRQKGRHLGRTSSHRQALMKNLASSLFLTERDAEFDKNPPKHRGRIVTTLHKAKEVRPLVERCITIAKRSLPAEKAARGLESSAAKGTDAWKAWRQGDGWREWAAARAPLVNARRRALQLLGNKQAVQILFEVIAPRYTARPGGYTRVLRLAKPRLGDAGTRAILEFVGVNDRTARTRETTVPKVVVEDQGSPNSGEDTRDA